MLSAWLIVVRDHDHHVALQLVRVVALPFIRAHGISCGD